MFWAYHTTVESALGLIAGGGLRPSDQSSTRRGAPILFFAENAAGAYRYFIDREDPVLLRFPWPSDARPAHDEWLSQLVVPPDVIEVYTGRALDRVADAYYLSEPEDRVDVLDRLPASLNKKIEHARTWAPILRYY